MRIDNIETSDQHLGKLDTVKITLSRRNLLTLLAKLDGYPHKSMGVIWRATDSGNLFVHAEEDAVHYADRQYGVMHPTTERRIREQQHAS